MKRRAIAKTKQGKGFKAWEWIPGVTIYNHKFGKLVRRKLKSGDFTVYPNPVSKNSKVTIKVNPNHLPQRLIKIEIPTTDIEKNFYDVKESILNFTSPNTVGSYDIIVYDNNNTIIDTIELRVN